MPRIYHVIGLGVAQQATLSAAAQQALATSTAVIGAQRQLATVAHYLPATMTIHELPPLSQLAALLAQQGEQSVCLLASGDPLYYGIGRWLLQHYTRDTLQFYPAISSIQAACHALGLALQDVQVVSLHGRPLATLRRHLARHTTLLCLTDANSTPQALAQLCYDTGYAESRLWVCERLGYSDQRVQAFTVAELIKPPPADDTLTAEPTDVATPPFDPLHISVLEVRGAGSYLTAGPGIADSDFITDAARGSGLLSKREVRMATLGLLPAKPQQVCWDVGAGCGGVAVEWALLQAGSQIYAIEHHAQRLACLQQNRVRFGVVDNLQVVHGRAPACLAELPAPDAVFIGGSDGELVALLALCWARLAPGGVLVASAVMESTRARLLAFADSLDLPDDAVETLQVAISQGRKLAGQWAYQPKLPVALLSLQKV